MLYSDVSGEFIWKNTFSAVLNTSINILNVWVYLLVYPPFFKGEQLL